MAFLQDYFTAFPRIDFCICLRSCFSEAAMHLHCYLSLIFELILASSRKPHRFCDCRIFPATSSVDPAPPSHFKNSFFLDRKDSRSSAAIKSYFFFGLVQRGERAHRVEWRLMEIRKAVLLAFALSFALTFRCRDLRWFCFGRKERDDGDLQYE